MNAVLGLTLLLFPIPIGWWLLRHLAETRPFWIGAAVVAALAASGAVPMHLGAGGQYSSVVFAALAPVLMTASVAGQLACRRIGVGYWRGNEATVGAAAAAVVGGVLLVVAVSALSLIAYGARPAPLADPSLAAWAGREVAFSVGETIVHQGCILPFLVYVLRRQPSGRVLALVLSAFVFVFQHPLPLPPWWILAAGLIFGAIFLRFGFWATVLCHLGANLANEAVLPLWLKMWVES